MSKSSFRLLKLGILFFLSCSAVTNAAYTPDTEVILDAHQMALKSAEGYVNEGAVNLDMELRDKGGEGDKKFASDEDKILEVVSLH